VLVKLGFVLLYLEFDLLGFTANRINLLSQILDLGLELMLSIDERILFLVHLFFVFPKFFSFLSDLHL
jgi:hypothetical protein